MAKVYFNKKLFILFVLLGVLTSSFTLLLLSHFSQKDLVELFLTVFIGSLAISLFLGYLFSLYHKKQQDILDNKLQLKTEELEKSLFLVDKYIIRTTTDTKGVITSANKAFCEISGYTQEELLGKSPSLIRHPDMPKSAFKGLWDTIKTGKSWTGEVKNKRKDGTFYWVKAYIEPLFDSEHNIVGYSAIRQDISDKKKLEILNKTLNQKIQQEVQKSTQQLENIQKEQLENVKLSSIGSLAAGITHEINTPLTYIKGNFELMQYDIDDLEPSGIKTRMQHDSLKIIEGIDRIANIIESMKEVSQVASESKESVNIYSTIITALTVSNNSINQMTDLFLNGELFDINMDKNRYQFYSRVQKQRIEQVWIVIIKNALDQLIYIDQYENRKFTIDIEQRDNNIIVKFKDNGGGIDENILENIFEPFVSFKKHGGIGVGLNIAKKIIEDQGGKIVAYNEDDGAVFEVRLQVETKG